MFEWHRVLWGLIEPNPARCEMLFNSVNPARKWSHQSNKNPSILDENQVLVNTHQTYMKKTSNSIETR